MYVGIITSFHGVKGEVKVKTKLKDIKNIFLVGNKLIIDNKEYEVTSYRKHKDYHMICFKGFSNLNEVMYLKNKKVFIDIKPNINSKYRIIGYQVKSADKMIGIVTDIVNYGSCDIIEVEESKNTVNIPYLEDSVIIDDTNKLIIVSKEMII